MTLVNHIIGALCLMAAVDGFAFGFNMGAFWALHDDQECPGSFDIQEYYYITSTNVRTPRFIRWSPAAGAESYDVYVSNDRNCQDTMFVGEVSASTLSINFTTHYTSRHNYACVYAKKSTCENPKPAADNGCQVIFRYGPSNC